MSAEQQETLEKMAEEILAQPVKKGENVVGNKYFSKIYGSKSFKAITPDKMKAFAPYMSKRKSTLLRDSVGASNESSIPNILPDQRLVDQNLYQGVSSRANYQLTKMNQALVDNTVQANESNVLKNRIVKM